MEARRLTMACLAARIRAPTAMVIERTVGMATGTAATVRTNANRIVVSMGSPRNSATVMIKITRTKARTMR